MIIFQGFGFLVLFVPIAFYAAVVSVCRSSFGVSYTNTHAWPGALGTALGAALLWFLAEKLKSPGRVLVDPATGQQVILRKKHSFFFIPLAYWGYIMFAIALGMLLFRKDSPL